MPLVNDRIFLVRRSSSKLGTAMQFSSRRVRIPADAVMTSLGLRTVAETPSLPRKRQSTSSQVYSSAQPQNSGAFVGLEAEVLLRPDPQRSVGCASSTGAACACRRTPPPRYSPKIENEPKKCFRINKSSQKRTQNEPKRTQALQVLRDLTLLQSTRRFPANENEPRANPKRTRRNGEQFPERTSDSNLFPECALRSIEARVCSQEWAMPAKTAGYD
jgi:hypothetical protein